VRSTSPARRSAIAIGAATAINLPLGTIYAYSVFLKPMESLLAVSRTEMSIVFAIAAIGFTVGMNVTPRLYRALSPVLLLVASGTASSIGLFVAARASGFAELVLGYGVLFGLGGGCAFTVVQQGVNQSTVKMSGLVNGYVVSLLPLGAMIGAPLIGWTIERVGLRAAMAWLGFIVCATALVAAALVRTAGIRMIDESAPATSLDHSRMDVFARLFTVFFLAASAGLMVLSQAAGMLAAYGGQTALALAGTTIITGGIAAARLGGGWLVDRFRVSVVGALAHLLSLVGALILTLWPGPLVAVPTLMMIGVGYGLISGSSVGAIAQYWHKNAFGKVTSRLYIAWCIAAVSLPVLAGWLFDRTQGYGTAILIAAAGNVLGAAVSLTLPRADHRPGRGGRPVTTSSD
jgi:OFA family oxalate/formate antiporter-like MFS transporter